MSWWWCCFSACYQCVFSGAFHVTLWAHKHSCCLNSVRLLQGGVSKASRRGGKVIRTPAMGKQTASPDCHVPSGSMLRDNSVAWGTPRHSVGLPLRCFVPISFLMLSPSFVPIQLGEPQPTLEVWLKYLSFVTLLYSLMCNKGKVISVFSVKL